MCNFHALATPETVLEIFLLFFFFFPKRPQKPEENCVINGIFELLGSDTQQSLSYYDHIFLPVFVIAIFVGLGFNKSLPTIKQTPGNKPFLFFLKVLPLFVLLSLCSFFFHKSYFLSFHLYLSIVSFFPYCLYHLLLYSKIDVYSFIHKAIPYAQLLTYILFIEYISVSYLPVPTQIVQYAIDFREGYRGLLFESQ